MAGIADSALMRAGPAAGRGIDLIYSSTVGQFSNARLTLDIGYDTSGILPRPCLGITDTILRHRRRLLQRVSRSRRRVLGEREHLDGYMENKHEIINTSHEAMKIPLIGQFVGQKPVKSRLLYVKFAAILRHPHRGLNTMPRPISAAPSKGYFWPSSLHIRATVFS